MRRRTSSTLAITAIFVLCSILSACSQGTSGSASFNSTFVPETATTSPTETIVSTPIQRLTASPTSEIAKRTPIVIEQPTRAISPTPDTTPVDQETPAALLNINRPGPNSRLSSPIVINAFSQPGDDLKVTILLYGEDGRLMAEKLLKLQDSYTGWVSFYTEIPFEINTATESASLVMITNDYYGRKIALLNIPLILMQVGESEIENAGFQYTPFYFTEPVENDSISGGVLHIEGFAHPYNLNPVIIELIKENGAVVATQIVPIKAAADGANYTPFSANLEYTVSQTTSVRLTIRQMMDHSPYLDLALSSILITLNP